MNVCEYQGVRRLDDLGIDYVIKRNQHSEAFTCAEVARERGVPLAQVLKCMVGKEPKNSEDGIYVMMISGDKKIALSKVRHLAGGGKISLFSRSDLTKKFDVTVGAITPLQFLGKARFFLDRTALQEEYVDISTGFPDSGIWLKTTDLVKLLNPTIADIMSE